MFRKARQEEGETDRKTRDKLERQTEKTDERDSTESDRSHFI